VLVCFACVLTSALCPEAMQEKTSVKRRIDIPNTVQSEAR
jgi:hypothetical protein